MSVLADRLDRLLAMQEIELADEQVAKLVRLTEELLRWNRSRNLTAISDLDEILEKHIIDSLTLLPYAWPAQQLLDIGSGAGFPSLPIKISCPSLKVVSVDAVAKKVAFQKHVARLFNLAGFTAQHGRIELLGKSSTFAGHFDLVTARAVGSLPLLARLAAPCLAAGGRLIAMKGPEGVKEVEECRTQLSSEGWRIQCETLHLPESKARRCLLFLTLNHKI